MTSAQFPVWIDAQHQTRKITVTENGTSAHVVSTETVTSINQPVTVTTPPASQVTAIPAGALNG